MHSLALAPSTVELDALSFLQNLIERGGPDPADYAEFTDLIAYLAEHLSYSQNPDEEIATLRRFFSEEFLAATIHGHILGRPYGYAGDFAVIDKIYTQHVSADPRYQKWDAFFHSLSSPQAVRNRKEYFKKTLRRALRESTKSELHLLDVASGPARDLAELYPLIDPARLRTSCVEMDPHAIQYAKSLTADFTGRITFIEKNIFRFAPEETYDFIWSAGLFDYFDDTTFVRILARFKNWLSEGGEIVIGNFSPENPNRAYMELFGNWYLHHRSEEELYTLARRAGFAPGAIRVGQEPEGVNLFVHLRG